jgi:hypothetical protein
MRQKEEEPRRTMQKETLSTASSQCARPRRQCAPDRDQARARLLMLREYGPTFERQFNLAPSCANGRYDICLFFCWIDTVNHSAEPRRHALQARLCSLAKSFRVCNPNTAVIHGYSCRRHLACRETMPRYLPPASTLEPVSGRRARSNASSV